MILTRKKRLFVLGTLGMLAAITCAAWLERTPLLAWYFLRGLADASESERDRWVERAVELDEAAVPGLLGLLAKDDARACANAEAALSRLPERWGPEDDRTERLAGNLLERFSTLPLSGQRAAMRLQSVWLRPADDLSKASPGLAANAVKFLIQAARVVDPELRAATLQLAVTLQPPAASAADPSWAQAAPVVRELARQHLRDSVAANRVFAVQIGQSRCPELLPQVASLLEDAAPEVRRAAILAVGHVAQPGQEVVATEDLFPWLHDSDADVRRICEVALRVRGLDDDYLRLAALSTHRNASVRLQMLENIRYESEREPWFWLRRLSHDPAPEVRVAAIRAASEHAEVDLNDRLDQMARNDPSPTVSQLARYYLNCPKSRRNER